jgi:hypothetical protein
MKKKRLGEILRERNHVSVENLDKAIQDQQGKLVHLGELLLQRGAVSKSDLVSALVETSRIPYFDCTNVELDAETLRLITSTMARKCCALPLETLGNKLVVVMAEPQNLLFLDEPIRASIREGGHSDEIRTLARQNGMKLMQEYALEHVRDGLTTLEEVQHVVPFASVSSVYCVGCARELSAAFSFCPHCGRKRNSNKAVNHKRFAMVPADVEDE